MNAKFNAENVVITRSGRTLKNSYFSFGKKVRQIVLRKEGDQWVPAPVVCYQNGTTLQGIFQGDVVIRCTITVFNSWTVHYKVVGDKQELAECQTGACLSPELSAWLGSPHDGDILPGWDGHDMPLRYEERSSLHRDLNKAVREYDRELRVAAGKFLQRVGSALMR